MATPVERWTPAGPITLPVPSAEIEQTAARTKASAGEPGPWGLVSFATGTCVCNPYVCNRYDVVPPCERAPRRARQGG
jgi:hypothetical protein